MNENPLHTLIARLWTAPTPADLWVLQAPLLALGTPEAQTVHEIAGKFYSYLSALEHKLTSQRYSQFAAVLETGAVATIGLEDVLSGEETNMWDLMIAGLAGALEVTAAFQHVKAWKTEACTSDHEAAWNLYALLFDLSARMQPNLAPDERAIHLERVLAPLRAGDTPGPVRSALIIRLYQLVLLLHLLPLVGKGDA